MALYKLLAAAAVAGTGKNNAAATALRTYMRAHASLILYTPMRTE